MYIHKNNNLTSYNERNYHIGTEVDLKIHNNEISYHKKYSPSVCFVNTLMFFQ